MRGTTRLFACTLALLAACATPQQVDELRADLARERALLQTLKELLDQEAAAPDPGPRPDDTILDSLGHASAAIGELSLHAVVDAGLRASLAELYAESGAPAEAEQQLRAAALAFGEAYGTDHTLTRDAQHGHALLLVELGRYEEASSLLRGLLVGLERMYGTEHPRTVAARLSLAELLRAMGDDAGAEALTRTAPTVGGEKRRDL